MDIKSSPEAIAKRIKELREKNGETQNDLAVALKCNQNNISKIESGKSLTSDNLIAIAEHYDVSLDYLCKGLGGANMLDTLSKYIQLYFSVRSGYTDDSNSITVPVMKLNKPLYDYLIQVAASENDKRIPPELKAQWIEIEIQKFNSRLQKDKYDDFVSFIPVDENTANHNNELMVTLSRSLNAN